MTALTRLAANRRRAAGAAARASRGEVEICALFVDSGSAVCLHDARWKLDAPDSALMPRNLRIEVWMTAPNNYTLNAKAE